MSDLASADLVFPFPDFTHRAWRHIFAPLEHKPLDDRCLQSLLFPSLVFFADAIGFALWLLFSNWRSLLLVFQNVRDHSIHSREALGLDAVNVARDDIASGTLRES